MVSRTQFCYWLAPAFDALLTGCVVPGPSQSRFSAPLAVPRALVVRLQLRARAPDQEGKRRRGSAAQRISSFRPPMPPP